MKHLFSAIALALTASAPLAASAGSITIDFDHQWNAENGDIGRYYAGGTTTDTRADTSTGPNLGFSFVNVSGLNNVPGFPAYSNAPSPIGTAYAEGSSSADLDANLPADASYINLASGFSNFSFFYSSAVGVVGAVKAYSGLNGTGTLLGSLDLTANDAGDYSQFTRAGFAFAGLARSFDITALGGDNTALIDNVTVVPEPSVALLLLAGGAIAVVRRRKPQA